MLYAHLFFRFETNQVFRSIFIKIFDRGAVWGKHTSLFSKKRTENSFKIGQNVDFAHYQSSRAHRISVDFAHYQSSRAHRMFGGSVFVNQGTYMGMMTRR